MSGFFGFFNRKGKSIDKNNIEKMFETMSECEPDESDLWTDYSIALGHAMLWNTPESQYEHLPLQEQMYVLAMDARIDNREELAKEIDLPDRELSKVGDSEFILGAYKKWGEECTKHLLGDFSFVIWDNKKEQIFCSRDYIGIKSFYYYLDEDIFVFSNDIKTLLSCNKIDKTLNDHAVANFIQYNILVEERYTFFKNIHKLHAANNLIVTKTKDASYIYWQAEECPQIHFNNIDEYIQRAKELLEKAVDARIRSSYSIASHLSGGLDSSSIAVLAARKLAKSGKKLIGFNWVSVLEDDNDKYFEWSYSKNISRLENIEHHALVLSEDDILSIYRSLNIVYGDILHFWYEYPIRAYAKEHGVRVILSGTGGDEFLSHNGCRYEKKNLWIEKIKKVHYTLVHEHKNPIKLFLEYIKRYVKFAINKVTLNSLHNESSSGFKRILHCLHPFMRHIINTQKTYDYLAEKNTVRSSMLDTINSAELQIRFDSWDVSGRLNKLEYRYPLLDRDIVEFALGIPENIFCHNDTKRFLFKEAVKNLLPLEIISSDTKYEPKRVRQFIELTQQAQFKWRHATTFDNKNRYIKVSSFYKLIDNLSMFDKQNDDIIIWINNIIMLLECNDKRE